MTYMTGTEMHKIHIIVYIIQYTHLLDPKQCVEKTDVDSS